jgi:outer membrane protein OmpA-like peptidoglycan-associated protein
MKRLALALLFGLGSSALGQEPPPSAAGQSGSWMVFFDWGKPELRSDDQSVLDQVAAAYRARPGERLLLTGHTDRSGRAAVNRAAGLKRAQSIRVELERRGIPRSAMNINSFGEERPLVPTEDGVREVQNRRVVIEFRE